MPTLNYYFLRTLSRVPLLLLMAGFDALVFHILLSPVLAAQDTMIWSSGYIFICVLVYLTFLALPDRTPLAASQPMTRDIKAVLLGSYIAKLVGLLIFLVAALLLGGIAGIGSLISQQPDLLLAWQGIRITGLLAALLLFLALLYGMFFNRYRFRLHKVVVPIANLPKQLDGFTLVQFSDAHLGSIPKPAAIRPGIDIINAQDADLVCFTGDLVNNIAEEAKPFVSELTKIRSKYGVVAILGNHDYGDYVRWSSADDKNQNLENLVSLHRNMNWRLLLDEAFELKIDGHTLSILGVQNISGRGGFRNYGNLAKAYSESSDATKILLTHDPSHWRSEVLNYKDITLSLAGHTHGMQFGFEWGNWIKWSPIQWIYKEWAGLYQEGEQFLYVNRGFGFLGYPGRVGILPEITRIELTCKD